MDYNIKPITLNIIPRQISNNRTVSIDTQITQNYPQFNHVPIAPVPRITRTNNSIEDLQERERIRLEKQRLSKSKYNNKVKNYTKIGSLDREEDKIKALLLLCYPSLNNMGNHELDLRISQFVKSLGLPYNPNYFN